MNRPANKPAVLYVTPGEPAGIGPELVLKALPQLTGILMAIVADRTLLENTARSMGLSEDLFSSGDIEIIHCPLIAPVIPGRLNPANSEYVLTTLQTAANLCLENHGSGLVTAPVHKGVINDSGIAFTGHTEFLADIAGVNRVVMMLANESFRVALVTTHLPLADVSSAINTANVKETIEIVAREMQSKFSVSQPRINVCGHKLTLLNYIISIAHYI